MTKLAPSMLAADQLRLFEGLDQVNIYADIVHLDVMDGHFVDNMALGTETCKAICKLATRPSYAHLMVTNPMHHLEAFWNMGCKAFVWHVELEIDHLDLILSVKEKQMCAGLAISPGTDIKLLKPYIDSVDLVTVMGVMPGKAGQAFIPETVNRVKAIRALSKNIAIEVDGGVNLENALSLVKAGADILVSGSSFFKSQDKMVFANSIRQLRR